jgi:hypothetical protein
MDQPYEQYDPFAEAGDPNGNYQERLRKLGWEEFLSVGDDRSVLYITSWKRTISDGDIEYILDVWDINQGSPFIKVDGFVTLMDLLSRWAPAVQAAAMVNLIDDFRDGDLGNGTVEQISARISYGITDTLPRMRQRKREDDERRRAIREQRQAQRRQTAAPAE